MPNLFELPGPRVGANNFTSEYLLPYGTTYTVEAGTTLYASLPRMFWADHNWPTFINHGTLWNISSYNISGVLAGYYIPWITNTGTMIAEATNGNAGAISVGSGGYSVENSGSIYAIANGNATAIAHWDPSVEIQNMGLIAAYAPNASTGGSGGVGSAVGVALYNGGLLVNGAGGSILAEGLHATAVIFGRGSPFGDAAIHNDGRIEAFSLTPGEPSYGITAGGEDVEIFYFFNNGLLKADIAWSSYGDHPLYAPKGMDRLVNEAGGSIVGRIETGRGEDSLINEGSISGDIALGDENDLFDTSAGSWTGAANLGWHDDVFLGSAGGDVVTGNRGSDQLTGNGGNDLLLGGIGHDRVVGGAGNDGLYGELGEDRLVTLGGDSVHGGDGDDFIEADDLSFALISGGSGYDTLRIDVGAIRLDLGAAMATGRLESIERISLQGGQQLAVRGGDPAALAGGTLDIIGQDGDQVALVGAWAEGAEIVRDGILCRSFALGSETVYVEASLTVVIAASMPAGFSGLAPIATGGVAPIAGSVPGGELADPVQEISWFHLFRDLVVDEGETWHSTDEPVIAGYSIVHGLVNGGHIETTNTGALNHIHTITNDVAYIINTGTIRGIGIGGAHIDTINVRGTLENSGTVEAIGDSGRVLAAEIGASWPGLVVDNHGTISARSSTGTAIGVQVDFVNDSTTGPTGANHGLIEAIGGAGTIAINLLTGGRFLNEGTIVAENTAASEAADAIAVLFSNIDPWPSLNQFVNHGSVSGVIAIRSLAGYYGAGGIDDVINTGRIEGKIQLGDGADIVDNAGAIIGRISLLSGADIYFGADATAGAVVAGGVGIDLLVGGTSADRLEGGTDNDLIIGGGGADVLIGGAGADRFAYYSPSDSVEAAADTIQDFESGVDRIDLGALEPTAVSLSTSDGITTISAQTASGTVTIRVSGTVTLADIDTATPNSVLTGTSAGEVLIARGESSEIVAQAGDDLLVGSDGNDRLDGGEGADQMHGGAGDDVFIVDNFADRLVERPGGGVDQVLAFADFELPDGVENLTLMASVVGTGNSLDNRLIGSSGDDGLLGGAGNDILIGGLGADYLIDGRGMDTFIYESAADSTATAYDTISGFEYGRDKIDLSAIQVLSISWTRVDTDFESYEEVTIETVDGLMKIRVDILNIATSGLSMSDFIFADARDDFNGDGRSDLLLRHDSGQVINWLGEADGGFVTNGHNSVINLATSWAVAGIGDFNGDGCDDLLLRHDNGQVIDWLGEADGGFVPNGNNSAINLPTTWNVAGIGDFNGDGRDDLLLRHDSGQVIDWLGETDGGFVANGNNSVINLPTTWAVAGTGDFNGDGRDDLLLRHDSGQVINWLGEADGGFLANGANSELNLPTTWDVVGTGDFNGDGRDDLLLRHDSGQVIDWLGEADGGFVANGNNSVINLPTTWDIAGIGDFNGDGREDLLLRHDSGQVIDWLGEADGGFVPNGNNSVINLPTSWHVETSDLL